MSEFKIGNYVKFINNEMHSQYPEYFPCYNTIGQIVDIDKNESLYLVLWPKKSTSGNDKWYCNKEDIVAVSDINMTNEEIWEMLKPKMEKNWLVPQWGDKELAYYQSDVINAIAIAYRSGYFRAMKGRPFKFGEKKVEEKKQGGHWEPVDPKNLLKEGTKVRYNRECSAYSNDIIKIGDTGVVVWEGMFTPMWFGIRPDSPRSYLTWIDFGNGAESCLDMWVEDNECK